MTDVVTCFIAPKTSRIGAPLFVYRADLTVPAITLQGELYSGERVGIRVDKRKAAMTTERTISGTDAARIAADMRAGEWVATQATAWPSGELVEWTGGTSGFGDAEAECQAAVKTN